MVLSNDLYVFVYFMFLGVHRLHKLGLDVKLFMFSGIEGINGFVLIKKKKDLFKLPISISYALEEF